MIIAGAKESERNAEQRRGDDELARRDRSASGFVVADRVDGNIEGIAERFLRLAGKQALLAKPQTDRGARAGLLGAMPPSRALRRLRHARDARRQRRSRQGAAQGAGKHEIEQRERREQLQR